MAETIMLLLVLLIAECSKNINLLFVMLGNEASVNCIVNDYCKKTILIASFPLLQPKDPSPDGYRDQGDKAKVFIDDSQLDCINNEWLFVMAIPMAIGRAIFGNHFKRP